MTIVTRNDRSRSVRSRCVIEIFNGVFELSIGIDVFVIRLCQISFFLLNKFSSYLLSVSIVNSAITKGSGSKLPLSAKVKTINYPFVSRQDIVMTPLFLC